MKHEPMRRDDAERREVNALADQSATGESPGGARTVDHLDAADSDTASRLEALERQSRRTRFLLLALVLLVGFVAFGRLVPSEQMSMRQTLTESKQLKLVDSSGNTRMFLRIYSHVPVLQLLDSKGKPRLSMGIRFDDTPFIDMSDKSGQTRATFEMTEEDEPTIRLYDEDGRASFTIN